MLGLGYAAMAATALLLAAVYVAHGDCMSMDALREMKSTLLPFAGNPAIDLITEKDAIWIAVGGFRGVWAILRSAGTISTMARRCAQLYPEAATAAEAIFMGGIELRIIATLCLIEGAICARSRHFPRAMVGALVRLYCDMMLDLEAAESIASVV